MGTTFLVTGLFAATDAVKAHFLVHVLVNGSLGKINIFRSSQELLYKAMADVTSAIVVYFTDCIVRQTDNFASFLQNSVIPSAP